MISYSLRCWAVGAMFVYRKALFACSKWSYTSFNWSLNRKMGIFIRAPFQGVRPLAQWHTGLCRSLTGPMDSNWTSAIINGLNGQKHVHRNRTRCLCVCGTMSSRRVTIHDETFDE